MVKPNRSPSSESSAEAATLMPSAEATPGYDPAVEDSIPRRREEEAAGKKGPLENHPSFEAAIAELGSIVEQLERGDLPLEQSLALFEKGIRLSRTAQNRLDAAERRVEELLGFDAADDPVTRRLDVE